MLLRYITKERKENCAGIGYNFEQRNCRISENEYFYNSISIDIDKNMHRPGLAAFVVRNTTDLVVIYLKQNIQLNNQAEQASVRRDS